MMRMLSDWRNSLPIKSKWKQCREKQAAVKNGYFKLQLAKLPEPQRMTYKKQSPGWLPKKGKWYFMDFEAYLALEGLLPELDQLSAPKRIKPLLNQTEFGFVKYSTGDDRHA